MATVKRLASRRLRIGERPVGLRPTLMKMPPEMVLFDCGGVVVVVTGEPLTASALRQNLNRHGLAVTQDQLVELFSGNMMSGLAQQARGMGAPLPAHGSMTPTFSKYVPKGAEQLPASDRSLTVLMRGGHPVPSV